MLNLRHSIELQMSFWIGLTVYLRYPYILNQTVYASFGMIPGPERFFMYLPTTTSTSVEVFLYFG